jgi:hypothetical protein
MKKTKERWGACGYCGKIVQLKPRQRRNSDIFCSDRCAHQHLLRAIFGIPEDRETYNPKLHGPLN